MLSLQLDEALHQLKFHLLNSPTQTLKHPPGANPAVWLRKRPDKLLPHQLLLQTGEADSTRSNRPTRSHPAVFPACLPICGIASAENGLLFTYQISPACDCVPCALALSRCRGTLTPKGKNKEINKIGRCSETACLDE